MRDKIFEINKKNYLVLEKEYEFSDFESEDIRDNYYPIINVNSYDDNWIKDQLSQCKAKFIKENKSFDLDIFKRDELDVLKNELEEYLDNIEKGKAKICYERKGDYFHWFKLPLDTFTYTLLISNKNQNQLEIYLKAILAEISIFIESEQAFIVQQIENSPEHTTETLSDLITHINGIEIVKSVKVQYKNIKGKRLKILLLALQDLNLVPKERNAQKFYNCCKKEFEWNIASYNAMNCYNFNEFIDNVEFTSMKQYLETLINKN